MSKSPLSGAFNENGAPEKKKNKKTGALLILAGVALTTSLGGVFAANTTINLGGNIEFGQGVTATTVCDDAITTSVEQSYTSGTFQVTRVALTGVDVSSTTKCGEKTIKVSLLDASGAAICDIAGTDSAIDMTLSATTAASTSDVVRLATAAGVTDGKFSVTAASGCGAATVDKVALSTSK